VQESKYSIRLALVIGKLFNSEKPTAKPEFSKLSQNIEILLEYYANLRFL
jgi:hypothetical protein